jgi:putative transposase
MSDYRRWFVPGGTFFFTVVTARRLPHFALPEARSRFGELLRECRQRWPFETIAMVLLHDHLHALWALPAGDADYEVRWGWVKKEFTRWHCAAGGREVHVSPSQRRRRRRGVWQRRYWEHTIDDQHDLERHFDYIHYNPVKHGLARAPRDWPHSTFHRWVESGHYDAGWGTLDNGPLDFDDLDESAME